MPELKRLSAFVLIIIITLVGCSHVDRYRSLANALSELSQIPESGGYVPTEHVLFMKSIWRAEAYLRELKIDLADEPFVSTADSAMKHYRQALMAWDLIEKRGPDENVALLSKENTYLFPEGTTTGHDAELAKATEGLEFDGKELIQLEEVRQLHLELAHHFTAKALKEFSGKT